MSLDLIAIFFLSIILGLLLFLFVSTQLRYEKLSFRRVEKDGGSFLLSKSLLNFGYWVLLPLANFLCRKNVAANQVTFFSLALSIPAAFLIAFEHLFLAGLFIAISGLCDGLDGMVARIEESESKYGEALDSFIDRLNEILVFCGFIFVFQREIWFVFAVATAAMGSLLSSYVSSQARYYRQQIPRGVMRKGERSFYLTIGLLTSPIFSLYAPEDYYLRYFLFTIMALMALSSFISSIYRYQVLLQKLAR